mmetsp:Transcript_95358/g.132459  ORF Transcript_95358/g.132459 Transcript_95358/m.132459 type:complete len:114 (-) Transcript_95358:279-620(-)
MGCAASVTPVTPFTSPVPAVCKDSSASTAAPAPLFTVSEKDHISFDEPDAIYASYEYPSDEPCGVSLPPGRVEHEMQIRRVERFMRSAKKRPHDFKELFATLEQPSDESDDAF